MFGRFLLLASLFLSFHTGFRAVAHEGAYIDPNGGSLSNAGVIIDPNGQPNSVAGDKGLGVDPNG